MKTVSAISTITQWAAVLLLLVGLNYLVWAIIHAQLYWQRPDWGTMPGSLVVLTALSFSFTWVKVWRVLPRTKPFKCLKCMTGWTSVTLAFLFHTPFCLAYVFIGLFTGAIVDALINKYL